MKNILFLFILFCWAANFNNFICQNLTENTAIAGTSQELAASKISGSYEFTLSQKTKEEDVTKAASYYPGFFTVSYNSSTHVASIEMVENNENSRRVLLRFLSSIRCQKIQVEGQSLFIHEFYDDYLK
jgi:hypothetical protein